MVVPWRILSLQNAEVGLISQMAQALSSAEIDSPEVQEVYPLWRRFHQQLTAIREALELRTQSFSEIQSVNLHNVLPGFERLDLTNCVSGFILKDLS